MTYEAKCKTCGKVHQYRAKVAERETTPVCCNERTERTLSTPDFICPKAAG
jgi:hypothetical protein